MGKRKTRGTTETEDLRGRLRELEKLNKQLLKRLGASRKALTRAEASLPTQAEEAQPEPSEEPIKEKCPSCGKKAIYTDLGLRELINCKHCGYRKSRKK